MLLRLDSYDLPLQIIAALIFPTADRKKAQKAQKAQKCLFLFGAFLRSSCAFL
jgi:hypothetical protein